MTRLTLLLVALFGFLLAGCGQSGPLYLPGDPSAIQQAPQPVEEQPVEDKAESEDEDDDEEPEEKDTQE